MAVRSLAQSSLRQNPQLNSMLAGYQPNAFHHLETVRVGGITSEVQFTNLDRYRDYQHLQIRAVIRNNNGSTFSFWRLQVNGDTANNYSRHLWFGEGSGLGSYVYPDQNNLGLGYGAGGSSTSGGFGLVIADLLDPFDTSKFKTLKSTFVSPNDYNMTGMNSGNWRNTAAISSIRIFPENNSIVAGCRFSLYGIKASA